MKTFLQGSLRIIITRFTFRNDSNFIRFKDSLDSTSEPSMSIEGIDYSREEVPTLSSKRDSLFKNGIKAGKEVSAHISHRPKFRTVYMRR
jgi:hypothetical protein